MEKAKTTPPSTSTQPRLVPLVFSIRHLLATFKSPLLLLAITHAPHCILPQAISSIFPDPWAGYPKISLFFVFFLYGFLPGEDGTPISKEKPPPPEFMKWVLTFLWMQLVVFHLKSLERLHGIYLGEMEKEALGCGLVAAGGSLVALMTELWEESFVWPDVERPVVDDWFNLMDELEKNKEPDAMELIKTGPPAVHCFFRSSLYLLPYVMAFITWWTEPWPGELVVVLALVVVCSAWLVAMFAAGVVLAEAPAPAPAWWVKVRWWICDSFSIDSYRKVVKKEEQDEAKLKTEVVHGCSLEKGSVSAEGTG